MVTLSAVTLAVLASCTCSSLNHGPFAATTGVTAPPPVPPVLAFVKPSELLWVGQPPVPVTTRVAVPRVALADAQTLRAALVPVVDVGLKVAVTPEGSVRALNGTEGG